MCGRNHLWKVSLLSAFTLELSNKRQNVDYGYEEASCVGMNYLDYGRSSELDLRWEKSTPLTLLSYPGPSYFSTSQSASDVSDSHCTRVLIAKVGIHCSLTAEEPAMTHFRVCCAVFGSI